MYKNPERSAQAYSAIESFRSRVVVLTNDAEYDWTQNSKNMQSDDGKWVLSSTDVTCYNLDSCRADDVVKDFETLGISLLVRLSSSEAVAPDLGYLKILLNKVRDIGYKARELGGTVTLILDRDTPVARLAMMGKLISDWEMDRVSERGIATLSHDHQGRYAVLSNSHTILDGLRGFCDPENDRRRHVDAPKRTLRELSDELCEVLAHCYADEVETFKQVFDGMCRDKAYLSKSLLRQCKREVGKGMSLANLTMVVRRKQRTDDGGVERPAQSVGVSSDFCGGEAVNPADDSTSDPVIPAGMNISTGGHREINPDISRVCYPVMVAKKVPKSQWKEPAVAKAFADELEKLMNIPWPKCSVKNPTGKGKGVWDISKVREKRQVIDDARRKGEKVHIGYICPLCYEKGSELPDGHSDKKLRARTVFLGNQVMDEYFQEAEMEGLGSAPPAMSDARAIQACALALATAIRF